MIRVVDSSRMSEIDRLTTADYGIESLVLMENAGIRIAEKLEELGLCSGAGPVIFLAGNGNNGGDALVASRQLWQRKHRNLRVLTFSDNGSSSFNINLAVCRKLGIPVEPFSSAAVEHLERAAVIVDGIAGTGLKGPLRPVQAEIVEAANACFAVRVAIDIPSGVGDGFREGYTVFRADHTLTIGLPLLSLYLPSARVFCGRIHVVEIGFPDSLKDADCVPDCFLFDFDDAPALAPGVPLSAHKYKRGHLAVFAGAENSAGAAVLCAAAADRTAAGLVRLFADDTVRTCAASQLKGVMVQSREMFGDSSFDAVAVGPGWGTEGRRDFFLELIGNESGVIDADGINILAAELAEGRRPDLGWKWVITPHAGEFRRLFPDLDPLNSPVQAVLEASRRLRAVVVLKQHVTYAGLRNGRCGIFDGMLPGLATGGSGDILCGLIGGYMAAGLPPDSAACLGVLVHHRAGVLCSRKSRWYAAEDLLDFLGEAQIGL